MKNIVLFFLMHFFCYTLCLGQKKKISLEAYPEFEYISGRSIISNDGLFVAFTIGRNDLTSRLVVKCLHGTLTRTYSNFKSYPRFSTDNRYLYFITRGDSLTKVQLSNGEMSTTANVVDYRLFNTANTPFIVKKFKGDSIAVESSVGNNKYLLRGISDYVISPLGNRIAFTTLEKNDKSSLILMDVASGDRKTIYGGKITKLIFDRAGERLAMVVRSGMNGEIWYFDKKNDKAVNIGSSITKEIADDILPGKVFGFSEDGCHVYFSVKKEQKESDGLPFRLDVLNSKDRFLDQSYGKTAAPVSEFIYGISLTNKNLTKLTTSKDEIFYDSRAYHPFVNRLQIISTNSNEYIEEEGDYCKKEIFLLDMVSGNRIKLTNALYRYSQTQVSISPDARFVIFFDEKKDKFISYELSSGVFRDLDIPSGKFINGDFTRREIFYWAKNDEYFVVGTNYELYSVDPLASRKTIALTSGAERNNITFTPLELGQKRVFINKKMIVGSKDLISKNIGFYSLDLKTAKLSKLFETSMDISANMGVAEQPYVSLEEEVFQANIAENVFLLTIQRRDSSANIYSTKDFRSFKKISDVHPEKGFNWFSKELMTYKDAQGKDYQGIIYKPHNFDPANKYPIIINIYESKSNGINHFNALQINKGDVDIPFMVEQGYLIYTPDIFTFPRQPGKDALLSVELALKNLKKISYIDSTKIGLSGGSYGGFEVRYIISHTKFNFAAVESNCAYSNFTTLELLRGTPKSSPMTFKHFSQYQFNVPLSQRPDLYQDASSAILEASNINTPLLMYHNEKDMIPYSQTFLLYCMMRELQKPAWWLNYKDEGHGILNPKAQLDLYERKLSFFDYYLKDKPMPKWMSEYKKF